MDHQPRSLVRRKKGARDRLIRLAKTHTDWLLAWEDECWFSRFAQPTLNAWTAGGKALALEQRERHPEDPDPKAVACYGALDQASERVLLRFSDGQPNSARTVEFLGYLLGVARQQGKRVLAVLWDQASWHTSAHVREWVQTHNRQTKEAGGVRLLTHLLPKKSPWLNRQEPQWVHAKRRVAEPRATLTARDLKARIRDHFHADAPLDQGTPSAVT